MATVEGADGAVAVHVEVERVTATTDLEVVVGVGGIERTVRLPHDADRTVAVVTVPGVRRWWPRGHGDQPLYGRDLVPVVESIVYGKCGLAARRLLARRVVGGDRRRWAGKPIFYALRHAHTDRLLTLQPAAPPAPGGMVVALVNDTDEPWRGTLAVSRHSYAGEVLAKEEIAVDVPARATIRVDVPGRVAAAEDAARELVVAGLGEARDVWIHADDRDSAPPAPRFVAAVRAIPEGLAVTVTARTLLRDLALLVDRVDPDAVVDDMLVSLLPGEAVTWVVRCSPAINPDSLLRTDVLRSANQLVDLIGDDHGTKART